MVEARRIELRSTKAPLIGISKLSRWFSLGRFARSDTLAAS